MPTISAGATQKRGGADVLIPYPLFDDFAHDRLSAGAFRAYAVLSLWKREGRYDGWPNQAHLATALNTTRRSVARYLSELSSCGHLRRIHHIPKNKVEYRLVSRDEATTQAVWSI